MCAHMQMEHLCLTTPQFRLVCYLCYYIVIIHGLCIYIYIDKYVCLYIYTYLKGMMEHVNDIIPFQLKILARSTFPSQIQ